MLYFSIPQDNEDCLLFQYMLTHGTKLAEIDFMVFLTIFEYAESNAERCQAQLFMQRLEFHDLIIGLENRSKISQKQRWQPVQGICMPVLYVIHSMRNAKINFTMFLTFFEYAESNAERCLVHLFTQRLEFYDLKLVSIITQEEHWRRGQQGVWSNIRHIYMLVLYILNYFRVFWI